LKSNAVTSNEKETPSTLDIRGTGNILVVVDSKEMKSANTFQLTTEQSTKVMLPSSQHAGKTSITYLSS
jgi:hypothetical protein